MFWQIVLAIVLLVAGFFFLVKGADWFVDGAAGLATKMGIPTLVIGLTVVAFGTSMPELAVSVSSSIQGGEGVAIGNVIGSNITNICLILGLSAVFCVLPVGKSLRRFDFPVLIGSSALILLFGATGWSIARWEGAILAALLVAYTVILIVKGLKDKKKGLVEFPEEEKTEPKNRVDAWYQSMKEKTWFLIVVTIVGLALIIGGANMAVEGATTIAKSLGVSDAVIGLTVVAIGTSLPELVTSVTAARKGETDIAVGNIVGSNIFNVLMVLGLSALCFPLPFESGFFYDGIIAVVAAVLLTVLGCLKNKRVGKAGGWILLGCFAAYYVFLFLREFGVITLPTLF